LVPVDEKTGEGREGEWGLWLVDGASLGDGNLEGSPPPAAFLFQTPLTIYARTFRTENLLQSLESNIRFVIVVHW